MKEQIQSALLSKPPMHKFNDDPLRSQMFLKSNASLPKKSRKDLLEKQARIADLQHVEGADGAPSLRDRASFSASAPPSSGFGPSSAASAGDDESSGSGANGSGGQQGSNALSRKPAPFNFEAPKKPEKILPPIKRYHRHKAQARKAAAERPDISDVCFFCVRLTIEGVSNSNN
jgi:hypothetical protein